MPIGEALAFHVLVYVVLNQNTDTSIFAKYWEFFTNMNTRFDDLEVVSREPGHDTGGASFNDEASTINDQGIDEQGKPAESDIDFINEE